MNTSNQALTIKNRLTSSLKYSGLMRFAISVFCVPFFSFGQMSLKAQEADVATLEEPETLWGEGREFFYEGEDFGYMIWDKDGKSVRYPTPSPQEMIDGLTASLAKPDDMGNEDKATQLALRGIMKSKLGDHQGAIKDLNVALNVPGINDRIKAGIFYNRGQVHNRLGHYQAAHNNYTAVLETPGIDTETKARALSYRAGTKLHLRDKQGVIDDLTAALDLPGLSNTLKVKTLINRGVWKSLLGPTREAIVDYTAALSMPDITDQIKAEILCLRGSAYRDLADGQKALENYEAALKVPGITAKTKASVLDNLDYIKSPAFDRQIMARDRLKQTQENKDQGWHWYSDTKQPVSTTPSQDVKEQASGESK